MAVGDRNDPYGAFNFLLEIDGLAVAGFSEVSGIATESDVVEYREGNQLATMKKLPGLIKYANIGLKRGFTQNVELWDWRKSTENGQTLRLGGAVVLLDEARQPVLRIKFREGWISKWEGPALNSANSEVAIESLEIAHEGIDLEVA
jgi:phage tail-like protein